LQVISQQYKVDLVAATADWNNVRKQSLPCPLPGAADTFFFTLTLGQLRTLTV
jgi:hypothetical protein